MENIRPRNDNILVELERPWAEYDGPLVLPDEIDPDKHDIRFGMVLAVGPGDHGEGRYEPDDPRRRRCKQHQPIPIEVGQRVLVDQIATHGFWPEVADGVHIIPWRQVLGIIEEPKPSEGFTRAWRDAVDRETGAAIAECRPTEYRHSEDPESVE